MGKSFFLIIMGLLVTLPFFDNGFATTYDINMPTGSSSPDAPYFWQNEKTGEATGDIEVSVGDTVVWKNGDQSKHTITSGTLEGGPDGIFGGTDFLVPGEFYQFQFNEKGRYPYFCLIHPWMTGVVTVIDGYKIVADVGKDAGDGLSLFNVDYQYNGIISDARVNEEEKSITFQVTSDSKSIDHTLMMIIPSELIDGPYVIFVDGEKNLRFDYIPEEDVNTIEIELTDSTKEITIVGTQIVPEFGILSIIVLGIAITSTILIQKSRITPKF